MATPDDAHDETGKLDLVPMIDCVMLLLLFFIMTSSFRNEEQRLSALLPTGEGGHPIPSIEPPPKVRIAVLPADGKDARVRIGGGDELRIDGAALAQPGGAAVEAALAGFYQALAQRLKDFEQPGDRLGQVPVEIHCATRLPWRHAMAVYDAVRGYESKLMTSETPIEAQRQVSFAAPTLRNASSDNEREERYRLEHLR